MSSRQASSKQSETSKRRSTLLFYKPFTLRTPQDDSEEANSRADSTSQNGKKTPSRFSIALETEPNATAMNTPGSLSTTHKKGRKTKGTANSTSGSVTDTILVSPPNQEEKGDVFKRLAMSKGIGGLSKDTKKMPKKEVEVNFFDNHFARPIAGKIFFGRENNYVKSLLILY